MHKKEFCFLAFENSWLRTIGRWFRWRWNPSSHYVSMRRKAYKASRYDEKGRAERWMWLS